MKKFYLPPLFLYASISRFSQEWTLVWSDEFSGDVVDPANWNFEIGGGGWGNNELQYYTNQPSNATVSDGSLKIIVREESIGPNDYTSARMITRNLHSWMYGKVEARIKVPSQQGLWPAFWMLGDSIGQVGWPQSGEIDIMEHVNTEEVTHGTMHWNYNGHQYYGTSIPGTPTDFQVYSIEWDESNINWFVDGVQYHNGNILNNINSTEEFHNPFFLLVNVAVGGNWPGPPNGNTMFPGTMSVDYVRVYQQDVLSAEDTKQQKTLHVYPNPSKDIFYLSLPNLTSEKIEVEVLDILGKVVLKELFQLSESACLVYLSELPQGAYCFRCIADNDTYVTRVLKID